MKKLLTLCFARDDSRILLAMKKRGFGAGRWNGCGGKLEKDETVEEAAIREVKEEVCLNVKSLVKRGIITFKGEEESDLEAHVFEILEYFGEPVETEEMKPELFDIQNIPYSKMWPDDPYWLPLFLEKKNFTGEFTLKEIISLTIK